MLPPEMSLVPDLCQGFSFRAHGGLQSPAQPSPHRGARVSARRCDCSAPCWEGQRTREGTFQITLALGGDGRADRVPAITEVSSQGDRELNT